MCRHCKNLTEDKEIVHKFMELGAKRISEKLHRTITADDIEVEMKIRPAEFIPGGIGDVMIPTYDGKGGMESARTRVMRMLDEMHR